MAIEEIQDQLEELEDIEGNGKYRPGPGGDTLS